MEQENNKKQAIKNKEYNKIYIGIISNYELPPIYLTGSSSL
jgi:hypothetical protein